MRILQVDTESSWRGGQRQTLLVARELAQRGHHCLVAARGGAPLALRARAAGLRVVDVHPLTELAVATALRLRRVIRDEQIDIVHAQAAHAHSLAALATLGTAARLVVTRHLSVPPRTNRGSRWKYGRAHAVIAVSRSAAAALQATGIVPGIVEVIAGGVEMHRSITPASTAVLESLGLRVGAPLVVVVGALSSQKDPLTFVRAMSIAREQVPNVQALWVGDGELRPAVERDIHALDLGDVVRLAGFRTDVDELMAAGRVLVLSSIFEGLPLVVMDAFALGIPVVATAAPGITDIIDGGVTGLLTPVRDPQALGAGLARVLREPELATSLRQGGLSRAPEYSIQHTVERTVDLYRRVLSGG